MFRRRPAISQGRQGFTCISYRALAAGADLRLSCIRIKSIYRKTFPSARAFANLVDVGRITARAGCWRSGITPGKHSVINLRFCQRRHINF